MNLVTLGLDDWWSTEDAEPQKAMSRWQSCNKFISQAMGGELSCPRRCPSRTSALSPLYSRGLYTAWEKANKRVFTFFWPVSVCVPCPVWMTTTAWWRCAMALMKGHCGGGRPRPPASSCPRWKMSGGACPCRSSTGPPFSAIPVPVSGLSFGSSRAAWVTGFFYERICQQNVVTWRCFNPSTGMHWRALINQMEPLTRRCWAFIIWFTLSWTGPVLSLTQLPMIPSLWYVFYPQRDWQWLRLKGTFLSRVCRTSKVGCLKNSSLNRKGGILYLFLNTATFAKRLNKKKKNLRVFCKR